MKATIIVEDVDQDQRCHIAVTFDCEVGRREQKLPSYQAVMAFKRAAMANAKKVAQRTATTEGGAS